MKLTTRLWVFGVLVPFVGFSVAVLAGARYLRSELEKVLDMALESQIAIEAVSLFDEPDFKPHLHVTQSPLAEMVRRVSAGAAIYGPNGEPILVYQPGPVPLTAPRLDVANAPITPVLETRRGPEGDRVRAVTLAVLDKQGKRYGLQLAASLRPSDATTVAFLRTGLAAALGLGALLFGLEGLLAHRLKRRVSALSSHMAALREGKLDTPPPADAGRDEIAELSTVVADATERLRDAREAQERLIAQAAHELRTPLQFLKTTLYLGLKRRHEPGELLRTLEEVRSEVDRLGLITNRILDLAAAERAVWDRVPGDLVGVVQDAAEAARATAEQKGILVQLEAAVSIPAFFDPQGLRQAVDNLLGNAVKFSPLGGTVLIAARRSGAVARIVVHDEGPGIPLAERERIFRPFERGSARMGGGTGLGLAIVREIARGHGGRVYVEDDGPGATVVLELPALPGDPARARGPTAPRPVEKPAA